MPQPPEGDVPALTKRLETLGCRQFAAAENKDKSHYPDPLKKKYKEDEEECFAAAFVLATAKVFNGLADSEAYKVLADEGHPDAMVATGVCLLEGLACEADEEAGKEQTLEFARLPPFSTGLRSIPTPVLPREAAQFQLSNKC